MGEIKKCSTCGIPKDAKLDYYKKTNICKVCRRITMAKWRVKNLAKMRTYYHNVIKPKRHASLQINQELVPGTGRITQTVVGREVERMARAALRSWNGESYWGERDLVEKPEDSPDLTDPDKTPGKMSDPAGPSPSPATPRSSSGTQG